MAKNKDILSQKKAELNTYINKFNKAIRMVTDTINSLTSINDGIVEKMKEIDAYQDELVRTKVSLSETKSKNERIIQNFNSLLNID